MWTTRRPRSRARSIARFMLAYSDPWTVWSAYGSLGRTSWPRDAIVRRTACVSESSLWSSNTTIEVSGQKRSIERTQFHRNWPRLYEKTAVRKLMPPGLQPGAATRAIDHQDARPD